MIKKIGKFKTSSDVLRITDPCYDKKVWCTGLLNNCKIGEWSGFLNYSDEGDWGIRVAECIAISGDFSVEEAQILLDSYIWENSNISVGVDSGQCGIFEDSKYPKSKTGEYGDKHSFYGKCCDLTLSVKQGGVLDFGIVSSSGYGDGSYDCYWCSFGLVSKPNEISAIKIVFISNEEDEENVEEN